MDSAFATRPFPGMTLSQLEAAVAAGTAPIHHREMMVSEIARRKKAQAGDVSVMSPAERLRWNRAHPES